MIDGNQNYYCLCQPSGCLDELDGHDSSKNLFYIDNIDMFNIERLN